MDILKGKNGKEWSYVSFVLGCTEKWTQIYIYSWTDLRLKLSSVSQCCKAWLIKSSSVRSWWWQPWFRCIPAERTPPWNKRTKESYKNVEQIYKLTMSSNLTHCELVDCLFPPVRPLRDPWSETAEMIYPGHVQRGRQIKWLWTMYQYRNTSLSGIQFSQEHSSETHTTEYI